MDDNRPLFILAGNGPYENRGCEAIVRGTTKILREHFKNPRFICLSFFQSEEQYKEQCRQETDEAITHYSTRDISISKTFQSFWKPESRRIAFKYFVGRDALLAETYHKIFPYLDSATAVLSVGGDNYSLDYGIPTHFTALDDLVLTHKSPLALWGASVGPFSATPDYEQYMRDHLRKITGIFARESATIEYLERIGVVQNVYPVADPAFVMDPVKPKDIDADLAIEKDAIGLNLSPLMAKFVNGGDMKAWTRMATSIISGISQATECPLYLIPHVIKQNNNDELFLQNVVSQIRNNKNSIVVVPSTYSAAETKWIIGKMAIFAGARTHATIAALSSSIPTLSFAYSIKAKGINQDLFGHTHYCLDPEDLQVQTVNERISYLLDHKLEIGLEIQHRIPDMQRKAFQAGEGLKNIVKEPKDA